MRHVYLTSFTIDRESPYAQGLLLTSRETISFHPSMVTRLCAVLSNVRSTLHVTKTLWYPTVMCEFTYTGPDRSPDKFFRLGLCPDALERLQEILRTCEVTAVSSAHIALVVSGHLDANKVDRGHVGQRPLCRGQVDCENTRVSQTKARKGR